MKEVTVNIEATKARAETYYIDNANRRHATKKEALKADKEILLRDQAFVSVIELKYTKYINVQWLYTFQIN